MAKVPKTRVRTRWGLAAQFGTSDSNQLRVAGRLLTQDIFPDTLGNPVRMSATEWAHRTHQTEMYEVLSTGHRNYKLYARAQNERWHLNPGLEEKFYNAVGEAIEKGGSPTGDKFVDAAANAWRKKYAEMLDMGKRHNVPGLDKITKDPNYFPHHWNQGSIDGLITEIGADGQKTVAEFLRKAWLDDIRINDPKLGMVPMEMKLQQKIVAGFMEKIRQVGFNQLEMETVFNADTRNELAAVLRDVFGTISDDNMTAVMLAFKKTVDPDQGKVSFARHRAQVNVNFKAPIKMANGEIRDVTIREMLDNNARRVGERYSRQLVGSSAMSEIYRVTRTTGDTAARRQETFIRRLSDDQRAHGVKEVSVQRQSKRLDAAIRIIRGVPLEEDAGISALARGVRNYNTTRIGGRFGLAQLADVGGMASYLGIRTLHRSMPVLLELKKAIREGGKISELSDLARENQMFMGYGNDVLLNRSAARLDAFGEVAGELGSKLERLAHTGAQLTMRATGTAMIDGTLRQMTANGMLTKWAGYGRSGRTPRKVLLDLMGLEQWEADIAVREIRAYQTRGSGNAKANGVGIGQWSAAAAEVESKFIAGIFRESGRLIQQQDIGQMALWMTTWWGRSIIQFRGFAIGAWEKSFLMNAYMLKQGEVQGAINTAYGLMAGELVYLAHVGLNSITKTPEEREEYLEESLSLSGLAKGAFSRANVSSVIPTMVDAAAAGIGAPQPFAGNRRDQLDADTIFGNPTLDLAKGLRGLNIFAAPLIPNYDATKGDFRAFRNLIPLQNFYGTQQGLDLIGRAYPDKRSQR